MTLRAIDTCFDIVRSDVVLGALTTELVVTTRPNCVFCGLITDSTYDDVEPGLQMLFENEIRVVRYLAHLHNQTEDICVVVQHDTLTNVGIKFSRGIGHNAPREVIFVLAKELVVQGDPEIASLSPKSTGRRNPLTLTV